MKCRKCFKAIPEGSNYCNWCGAAQHPHSHRRANGEGSVYMERKTRKWTAEYLVGYRNSEDDPLHYRKVVKRKRGLATKKEALDVLKKLKDEYGNTPVASNGIIAGSVQLPTLLVLWKQVERDVLPTVSKSRASLYRKAWDRLSDFHHRDIRDITVAEWQSVVDTHTPDGMYYPARDMKVLISQLYKAAESRGIVANNLAPFIKLPEHTDKQRKAFTLEEVNTFWKQYNDGDLFAGYILLMIYTGMMPGELFSCKLENVDLKNHRIVGAGKKTKKRKESPIIFGDEISHVLSALMKHSKEEGSDKLLPISRDVFYDTFPEKLKDYGVRPLTPYSCRHTTATVLADLNTPMPVIKEIMRHNQIMTTQIYIHTQEDSMRKAVDSMERKTTHKAEKTPPAE